MPENQNIEWKEAWKDEYLKWICGFANAQGGKIYIGIDDNGKVVGIKNSKQLLEEIPNKIQTTMGIIADVNLLHEGGAEYIEIAVAPSSYPVSFKGEYHYRSGSTKQQLKGAALTEFLVSKTGFKWDAVPVENIFVNDLDNESFDIFRREAIRSGRMSSDDLKMTNEELLDNLGLITNGKLKRAAVMLFYKRPEKLISGSYVKIGKFGKGSDLQYQDELHGSLITIADKLIDLIYLKYLKAKITYEKDIRIEKYPFPRDGVREVVYNALIHCNWADSTPIQIRIEDDAMYISNSCILPSDWTVDTLLQRHKSKPYNPDIANTFFRAGYVEIWGRGIQKVCEACVECGTHEPEYEVLGGDLTVKMFATKDGDQVNQDSNQVNQDSNQAPVDLLVAAILKNPITTQRELVATTGLSLNMVKYYMLKMQKDGILVREGTSQKGKWVVKNIENK